MPKKFAGENSKATAARQRKEAVKEAEKQKKQKEVEDAYWEDDDKKAKKRQSKKEEMEKKKQELLSKKAEAKELLEKEMSGITKSVKVPPPPKITRAQIQIDNEKRAVKKTTEETTPVETHIEKPLEENLNRAQPEEIATTIDEAIAMLSDTKLSTDKHPEKRMKAAYTAFEEKYLPIYKQENPTLRMSQLKQMLFKEWQKSSENPLNRPT